MWARSGECCPELGFPNELEVPPLLLPLPLQMQRHLVVGSSPAKPILLCCIYIYIMYMYIYTFMYIINFMVFSEAPCREHAWLEVHIDFCLHDLKNSQCTNDRSYFRVISICAITNPLQRPPD